MASIEASIKATQTHKEVQNMATIDIRNTEKDTVTHIKFHNASSKSQAECLEFSYQTGGGMWVNGGDSKWAVSLRSKEQTLNLIKALQKAIELEWVK